MFTIGVFLFVRLGVLVRRIMPRFRYDLLQKLMWKRVLPIRIVFFSLLFIFFWVGSLNRTVNCRFKSVYTQPLVWPRKVSFCFTGNCAYTPLSRN